MELKHKFPITGKELERYKKKVQMGDIVKTITRVEGEDRSIRIIEHRYEVIKKFPYIVILKDEKGCETSLTWKELLISNRQPIVQRLKADKAEERDSNILQFYKMGMSRLQITNKINCSYATVTKVIREYEKKQSKRGRCSY